LSTVGHLADKEMQNIEADVVNTSRYQRNVLQYNPLYWPLMSVCFGFLWPVETSLGESANIDLNERSVVRVYL